MKSKLLLFSTLFCLLAAPAELFSQSLAQGYPSGGVTVWENPVFLNFTHGYNPSESYDLQVATNASFTAPLIADVTLGNDIYGYSLSVNPSTTYYWRIRVHNSSTWISTSFVTASSSTPGTFTLSVNTTGTGSGTVTKNPDSLSYHNGTVVQLTATANPGSTFAGWSGDASGTANPLSVTMNGNKNITATFNTTSLGTFTLNVTTTGTGSGTVSKNPDSVSYHSGTIVQLTATPAVGSTFAGWSGDASGTANPLSVTMTGTKNITGTFNLTSGSGGLTFYVNSANASIGDGSLSNPFQRLDTAVAHSKASNRSGNHIIVLGGTYNYFVDVDDDSLTISANSTAFIKRLAVTSNNVTITGPFTITNQTSLGAGMIGYNCSNLTISNLTVTSDSAWGGYFVNVTGLTIANSSFNSNAASANPFGGVYLQGCSSITFSNVTANNNKQDGFVFTLISNGTFTNLTARNNSRYGLNLNESSSVSFIGGDFSHNLDGMHIHPHFDADVNSQDSINTLAFSGTVKADSNSQRGIVLMTDGIGLGSPAAANSTFINSPSFNGTFSLRGNGVGGILITGNVSNPSFSGFNFVGSSYGVQITGLSTNSFEPSGVKINNSSFTGFGSTFSNFAIQLADADSLGKTKWSDKLVDATNNQWFNLTDTSNTTGIKSKVWDSGDDSQLGWVNTSGGGFGTPTITIGSVSTNTGASVDIPVSLNLFATASYNSIVGKVYYDSTKVRFNSMSFGTGTLFNTAGWSASAGSAQVGSSKFKVVTIAGAGITPITTSGVLFKLNFTVVAAIADTTRLTGVNSEWNNGAFVVQNGVITYSLTPEGPSTMRGDATMNFVVDINDANAVLTHISSPYLTGQAKVNANADLDPDTNITTRDVHYIEYYILNGSWPIFLPSSPGVLALSSSVTAASLYIPDPVYFTGGSQAFVQIPLILKGGERVFSLDVTLTYDKDIIGYQTFKQLILSNGNLVTALQAEPGKARFIFVSGNLYNGDLNPGNITFRFNKGLPEASVIHTSYKINDGSEQLGPDIKLSNTGITSVDNQKTIPVKYDVSQNYPNPFNPSTIIRYSIPQTSLVTLKIYNILGQEVKTLVNSERSPGIYNVQWNGDDNFGQKVSSGIYIYRVTAGDFVQVKKMVLMK